MSFDYPVSCATLENGTRVLISEDHLVPEVSINISVNVGSRHEVPGQTGLAHLFEHLMFEGSANVAEGEHFALLMGHGGRCNATTSFDLTTYFQTVPSGAAELALWLEADRHTRLLPALTQQNLDNQRDVVVEEKRQRCDNQPYGDALEAMCAITFTHDHPYRHTPIGSMEDLGAASLETVRDFYATHYQPPRRIVTMVGDVTPEEGNAWARRYFGEPGTTEVATAAEPAPVPKAETATLPPHAAHQRLPMSSAVPSDRLYACFRLPEVNSPDFLACVLALDLVAGVTSSRVQRRLVRSDESAIDCAAGALGLIDGTSLGYVVIDVAATSTIDEVEASLCEELGTFSTDGPHDERLAAVYADNARAWLGALGSIEDRADVIGRAMSTHGDPNYINTYVDRMRAISAEDIRRAAQHYLAPEARGVVTYQRTAAGA
ncbi:MAG: pitrilysin family protein [Ornithinimicrobium sp.]